MTWDYGHNTAKKDIQAWKKINEGGNQYVAEMVIPEGAKYYSSSGLSSTGKNRAEYADVLAIYEPDISVPELPLKVKESIKVLETYLKKECKNRSDQYRDPYSLKRQLEGYKSPYISNTRLDSKTPLKLSSKKSVRHNGGHGPRMDYVVGKRAKPNGFSLSNDQCQQGLHFFTSPEAACNWRR